MVLEKKRLLRWGIAIAVLLLIPLIATLTSDEFNWKPSDFLVLGTVLLAVGLSYELIALRTKSTVYRGAIGLGLLGAFLLFWVNGAVGLIGNEAQDINLLFGSVFLIGIIGSFASRFKAKGMSRTMYLAAITQMLVPLFVLFVWPPPVISWSPGVFAVFLLCSFFAFLFLLSGMLFAKASGEVDR